MRIVICKSTACVCVCVLFLAEMDHLALRYTPQVPSHQLPTASSRQVACKVLVLPIVFPSCFPFGLVSSSFTCFLSQTQTLTLFLSVCLSVSVSPSLFVSVCLSFYISGYLCFFLSGHVFVWPSLCLFLSMCLSVFLSLIEN